MRDDHFIYYRRRAAEEKTAADRATSLAAARAHRQIAERYSELAESQCELAKANDA